jgi:cysteine synthase
LLGNLEVDDEDAMAQLRRDLCADAGEMEGTSSGAGWVGAVLNKFTTSDCSISGRF